MNTIKSKEELFLNEYKCIKNEKYVTNLKILINLLPDYFFEVAASSTGKYHPKFSLGEGGLLRHSKAAFKIGYELLNNNTIGYSFKDDEKDMMLFALLVHDGLKHGEEYSEWTVFDHPTQMSNFIKKNKDKLTLSDEEINFICSVIETHMGEWTKDYKGSEVLKKPSNKYQRFVHMCDFLASRKFLDITFKNDEIVEI